MPAVTRVGDKSTGHDNCPPVEAVEGSKNVFMNGKPAVLMGDKYAPHGCENHQIHQGILAGGSPSTFINGKSVGRVGDPISCGGTVAEGSNNIFIGNGNEQKRNKALCKRNEALTKYKRREEDDIFFCLPLIAEAMGNKASEKDRIGWHYLRDMFYKWLCGEANTDAKVNPNPFWVDIDWVLSYENMRAIYLAILRQEAITQDAIDSLMTILKRENYFQNKNIKFDFINSEWKQWQSLYFQHYRVNSIQAGIGTGLYACMGAFTFRFLPKGKIEYLGENNYKVILDEMAIFVHDSFNFEGDAFPLFDYLGYWSCEEKDVSSTSGVTNTSYIKMSNTKFRDFREYNKIGNDFLVLSKPKLIDNFEPYNYIYTHE